MRYRCRKCGEEFKTFAAVVYHGKSRHGKTCTKNDMKKVIKAYIPKDTPERMKKWFSGLGCLISVLCSGIVLVMYALLKGVTLPFHVIYELLD